MKRFPILIATSLFASAGVCAEKDANKIPTKHSMNEIYTAVQELLPYSLSQKKFNNQKSKEVIRKNLKVLAENADQLSKHGEHDEAPFKFIGATLAREAKRTYGLYEKGETKMALSSLDSVLDSCVACHTRYAANQSPRAQDLGKKVNLNELPLDEKARLFVITRQFDEAIATYKKLLSSPDYSVADIFVEDLIGDYLEISIRVKRDLPGTKATLETLKKREGMPTFAREDIDAWIASIDTLSKTRKLTPQISDVRRILNGATAPVQFPANRQSEINYLYAASLLNELVATNLSKEDKAEAYFLLGLTESLTGRTYWLSQSDYYLETAIRAEPSSKFARMAYRALEQSIIFGYSGSMGTNIPADVQKSLEELRVLVYPAKK